MRRIALLFGICIMFAISTICSAESLSKAQEYIDRTISRANEIINGENAKVKSENTENNNSEYQEEGSDDFDYSIMVDLFTRQEEYKTELLQTAGSRISEYWDVELIDLDLYLDDAFIFGESDKEHISVINVMLRWNVEKDAEQTRRMLSSYSDDMAVTLHSVYPDTPIDQMRIVWEVPNILKAGYAAKYQYYSIGDDMFCSDRYGVLYGKM